MWCRALMRWTRCSCSDGGDPNVRAHALLLAGAQGRERGGQSIVCVCTPPEGALCWLADGAALGLLSASPPFMAASRDRDPREEEGAKQERFKKTSPRSSAFIAGRNTACRPVTARAGSTTEMRVREAWTC